MKKFIIVLTLGITLIVIGSLVTASEISSWTLYDLKENVADFPIAKIETEISFNDLDNEKLKFIGYPKYNDDSILGFEGNFEYFNGDMMHNHGMMNGRVHMNMMFRGSNVDVVEDDVQPVGKVKVAYEYLDIFRTNNCEFESLTVEEVDGGYEFSKRHHSSKHGRKKYSTDSQNYSLDNDTSYLYVTCSDDISYFSLNDIFNLNSKERLKAILKNKQLPTPFGEYSIVINPQDKDKISY